MTTRPKVGIERQAKNGAGQSGPAQDRYLELVREFPLRLLRSEAEYEQAVAMLDRLSDLGPDRTEGETDYLLSLSVFVEKYEKERHPMPPVSGVEMLRYLLETHDLTQSQLAASTGLTVSTISEILAGKRKLGLRHIELLARHFSVNPAVFL
jgi:HTH-type transcriptional regulator / antitoxin HigA